MPICTLIYPSRGGNRTDICESIQSLKSACKDDPECIEICIKLDHDEDYDYYVNLLHDSGFPFKLIYYNQFQGLADVHFLEYEFSQLSNSNMIWLFADDLLIESPDLCTELRKACDLFDDDIFIYYGKYIKKRGGVRLCDKYPIIGRGLINCLQYVSPNCGVDQFYRSLAKSMKGRSVINDNLVIRHLRHRSERSPDISKAKYLRTFVLHDDEFINNTIKKYIIPSYVETENIEHRISQSGLRIAYR